MPPPPSVRFFLKNVFRFIVFVCRLAAYTGVYVCVYVFQHVKETMEVRRGS